MCCDARRDPHLLVVVETVADLWALERSGALKARYHVLGGTLSALDGIGPQDLHLDALVKRVSEDQVREVIIAVNATVAITVLMNTRFMSESPENFAVVRPREIPLPGVPGQTVEKENQ